MTTDKSKEFWSQESTSRHRDDDDAFYKKKAVEHAAVVHERDRSLESIDLGCGAGELLVFLKESMNVTMGIDYSEKMLAEAAARNPDIRFAKVDFEEFVSTCDFPVWMATGSVNQYIAPSGQKRVLDQFVANPASKSLYMFDNVDPARYILSGRARVLSYRSAEPISRIRLLYGIAGLAYHGLLSREPLNVVRLGTVMGYAYRPAFWIAECEKRGLSIEVISSKYYEYRYHLTIEK